MLTPNEKKILRLLMVPSNITYSINQVAKECGLTPGGAFKILKKFEGEGILIPEAVANAISYKLNFKNPKTGAVLELALISDVKGKIRYREEDFKGLKGVAKACVLFGSYIDPKAAPHDLDVLFVFDKDKFKEYKKKLNEIKEIAPVKIHDIIQTEEDLKANIIKKDKVILEIIGEGIFLWGQRAIVRVISDACQK